MADAVMPSPPQVPSVTSEDLYHFHTRVFGFPAPSQPIYKDEASCNDAAHGEASGVEKDDLGYYPDGAKRTLTDDQIAMFRHSEIYSIQRERQVRKENLEAEGDGQAETIGLRPEEAVEATALSDEEGEVRSDGEVTEVLPTVPESTPQHVETTYARKKQKTGDTDTGFAHGRKYASRSARGLVRELDSAVVEDQTPLDYGDELLPAEGSKQNEVAAMQVAEKLMERKAPSVKGKKIWWPIIEAT